MKQINNKTFIEKHSSQILSSLEKLKMLQTETLNNSENYEEIIKPVCFGKFNVY